MDETERIKYDILSSPLKKLILEELDQKPQTASYMAKEKQKHRASISRAFRELKEIGLIRCKNEWLHRFRFYSITEKGKNILQKIKEMEE